MPDYFTKARRDQFRKEVQAGGFRRDEFLGNDPDCPVFGLNVACAFPFPEPLAERYQIFGRELQRMGRFVYVYPHWETHITIATFLNFSWNRKPDEDRTAYLLSLKDQIFDCLQDEFQKRLARIAPFSLVTQPPVLSPATIVLPFADASGSISAIRQELTSQIKQNGALFEQLGKSGFRVPDIVHSTVARFTDSSPEPSSCLPIFDAAAEILPETEIRVSDIFMTTETKPYMRGGEIIKRFQLQNRR